MRKMDELFERFCRKTLLQWEDIWGIDNLVDIYEIEGCDLALESRQSILLSTPDSWILENASVSYGTAEFYSYVSLIYDTESYIRSVWNFFVTEFMNNLCFDAHTFLLQMADAQNKRRARSDPKEVVSSFFMVTIVQILVEEFYKHKNDFILFDVIELPSDEIFQDYSFGIVEVHSPKYSRLGYVFSV